MQRIALPLVLVASAALLSCDSGPRPPTAEFTATTIELTTGTFTVSAATDTFESFYTATPLDRDYAVTRAIPHQMTGGHHISVYWTTSFRDVQHHPCDDAEMATWNFVVAAGGEAGGTADQSLPDGLA